MRRFALSKSLRGSEKETYLYWQEVASALVEDLAMVVRASTWDREHTRQRLNEVTADLDDWADELALRPKWKKTAPLLTALAAARDWTRVARALCDPAGAKLEESLFNQFCIHNLRASPPILPRDLLRAPAPHAAMHTVVAEILRRPVVVMNPVKTLVCWLVVSRVSGSGASGGAPHPLFALLAQHTEDFASSIALAFDAANPQGNAGFWWLETHDGRALTERRFVFGDSAGAAAFRAWFDLETEAASIADRLVLGTIDGPLASQAELMPLDDGLAKRKVEAVLSEGIRVREIEVFSKSNAREVCAALAQHPLARRTRVRYLEDVSPKETVTLRQRKPPVFEIPPRKRKGFLKVEGGGR
jgi:hypothetical protein